jgi:hypothetical protein
MKTLIIVVSNKSQVEQILIKSSREITNIFQFCSFLFRLLNKQFNQKLKSAKDNLCQHMFR